MPRLDPPSEGIGGKRDEGLRPDVQSGSTETPPRRPRRRRKLVAGGLIGLAAALILVAVAVAGYPFYTDIQAGRHQKTLKSLLDQAAKDSGAARLQLLQQYQSRSLALGSPVTRLIIPKLNVDTIVVEGTSDEALAVGAGHYPQSPLPGEVGNMGIAGHRTMNGHPFGDLDKLSPGDKVTLVTPFGQYNYEIVAPFEGHPNPWVTTPTDWSVISYPTQARLLTMTTCNPKGQKTERLVARAQMVSSQPTA